MPILTIEPDITENELFRLMGSGNRQPGEAVLNVVRKYMSECKPMLSPRIIYDYKRIEERSEEYIEVEGKRFLCEGLTKETHECESIVCYAMTIGKALEKEVSMLSEQGEITEAYVLDAIGSVAVENIAVKFALGLEKELVGEGKSLTWSFSPGYCDWDVEGQRELFSVMDAGQVGITLNESCLMSPRKSISGVFGILPHITGKPVAERNPCFKCSRKDCFARRK